MRASSAPVSVSIGCARPSPAAGSTTRRSFPPPPKRASACHPRLRHALAAQERGNFEAAFWLLNEAFGANQDDLAVADEYWKVALALGRVDIASPAAVSLIVRHAHSNDVDLAAQYWLELGGAAPDVLIPSEAIAAILPALKKRQAEADEEEAALLRGPLRRAMRHAIDPRNGPLHPGVALRLFEEGH